MNCTEINNAGLHEQYLLKRLSEKEQADYEIHLEGCRSCQNHQRRDKELLAGIRHAGRLAMKAEIRQQTDQVKGAQNIRWVAVYKIAAVLLMSILMPTMFYIYSTQDLFNREGGVPDRTEALRQDYRRPASALEFHAEPFQQEEAKINRISPAPPVLPKTKSLLKMESSPSGSSLTSQAGTANKSLVTATKRLFKKEEKKQITGTDKRIVVLFDSMNIPSAESRGFDDEVLTGYHEKTLPENIRAVSIDSTKWQFQISGTSIVIYVEVAKDHRTVDALPDSFKVVFNQQDSLRWYMTWYLPEKLAQYNLEVIELNLIDQNSMTVSFVADSLVYLMNLGTKPLKGVRVR